MKKFPLKWKLFLVFSYILLLAFCGVLYITIRLVVTSRHISDNTRDATEIIAGGIVVICVNYFLNIYAAHRYFPDITVPSKTKILMKLTGILAGLLWVGLLIVCIAGLKDLLSRNSGDDNKTDWITLSIVFFLWILGLYTLILQTRLFYFLDRNYNEKMHAMLDSLGKD